MTKGVPHLSILGDFCRLMPFCYTIVTVRGLYYPPPFWMFLRRLGTFTCDAPAPPYPP